MVDADRSLTARLAHRHTRKTYASLHAAAGVTDGQTGLAIHAGPSIFLRGGGGRMPRTGIPQTSEFSFSSLPAHDSTYIRRYVLGSHLPSAAPSAGGKRRAGVRISARPDVWEQILSASHLYFLPSQGTLSTYRHSGYANDDSDFSPGIARQLVATAQAQPHQYEVLLRGTECAQVHHQRSRFRIDEQDSGQEPCPTRRSVGAGAGGPFQRAIG
ncbi:hypothetical protein B0J13DRAFT_324422 [Dactylonectria estremocensis]|uniref:Uncharacterized protein n=1 Tax=Dactylonectria estremocensis TaxID=1079267 RepID=A0A9P9EUQ6_9HYPO|nr:hypothetical protein B0J13DRAFT_324422 [Dactylonectria estremocensis]